MGMIRFCLALAVVSTHTNELLPFHMIFGFFAVKIFFIISGFYMALVLDEKYFKQKKSYMLFISNRFYRLFPLYFVVMFLSIVLYAAAVYFKGGEIAHYGSSLYNPVVEFIHLNSPFKNNFAYYLVILFTNVFILGLESLYFFSVPIIAVVPQAWSLSLELYFYLLAPVLVRQKTGVLMVLFLVSVLWRLFFLKLGYVGDKWYFSFFPFEIAFFVLGIFSYRIYKNNFLKRVPGRFFFAAIVLVLTPIINLPIIENFNFYSNAWNAVAVFLIFFILIVLGLPIIFSYTKNWVVDRWIGEFSYPIYIVHFSVIYFLRCFLGMSNVDPMFGWKVVVFSFVITLVLLYIIVYPIERLRMSRILSHKL